MSWFIGFVCGFTVWPALMIGHILGGKVFRWAWADARATYRLARTRVGVLRAARGAFWKFVHSFRQALSDYRNGVERAR